MKNSACLSISTSRTLEVMQPHYLGDNSRVLLALTEKLHSLPAVNTILLKTYRALSQAKSFSSLFDFSNANNSSLKKNVVISSRDGTNLSLGYTKVVIQFQAKLGLLRKASQREVAVKSLASLQKTFSVFFLSQYINIHLAVILSMNAMNGCLQILTLKMVL